MPAALEHSLCAAATALLSTLCTPCAAQDPLTTRCESAPSGHVLIDSLYAPYTDGLLDNIRRLGHDPKDIELVLMTHGHRDLAGGAARLKHLLEPGTRFAMSAEGWREAAQTAARTTASPIAWTMIDRDLVLTDGQTVSGGDIDVQAFETPGHTMGTMSFAFGARCGPSRSAGSASASILRRPDLAA